MTMPLTSHPHADYPELRVFGDEMIDGEWSVIYGEQEVGAIDAAEIFGQIAFVKKPELIGVEGCALAIDTAKQAGRLLLLSTISQPFVGDIETSGQWQSLTNNVFVMKHALEGRIVSPSWHPFRWIG